MTTPEMIEMKLTTTNVLTRWPCHVCGGCTEKVDVLVEGDRNGPHGGLRCCENCLKEGDVDGRLSKHAASLKQEAAKTRALIGRLKVPTFAEWEAYEKRVGVAQAVAHSLRDNGFRVADTDGAYNKIMADDEFYAKWRKQLEQEEDDYNRQLEHQRARRELLGLPEYEVVDDDLPF